MENTENEKAGKRESADTWRVHILGPDDLLPMENELQALREANLLNIGLARWRLPAFPLSRSLALHFPKEPAMAP